MIVFNKNKEFFMIKIRFKMKMSKNNKKFMIYQI